MSDRLGLQMTRRLRLLNRTRGKIKWCTSDLKGEGCEHVRMCRPSQGQSIISVHIMCIETHVYVRFKSSHEFERVRRGIQDGFERGKGRGG